MQSDCLLSLSFIVDLGNKKIFASRQCVEFASQINNSGNMKDSVELKYSVYQEHYY